MINNRNGAKSLGITRYFTGKPCKYGHIAERHTANYTCVICQTAIVVPKEIKAKYRKVWYDKTNKEQRLAHSRSYKEKYPEKYKLMEYICSSGNRKERRLRKVKWVNKDKIACYYIKAKFMTWFTNEEYQVDHIIPLKGKYVSGLHVENNLQVILKSENYKKRNYFNGDI